MKPDIPREGYVRRSGFRASLIPSPTRLKARTVRKMAAPGKTVSHQPWRRKPCALKSMLPQLTTF
jgi:hypothetical protein